MARKKIKRTCKGCGQPEKRTALGFTNIAPHLGYCADCINRAFDAADRAAGITDDMSFEEKLERRVRYDELVSKVGA